MASPTLAASAPALEEWRSKCVVIPYGVHAARVPASDAVLQRAEVIRREHKRPIVLFVGRLVGYKGVDVLLDAMRDSPAVALIVGGLVFTGMALQLTYRKREAPAAAKAPPAAAPAQAQQAAAAPPSLTQAHGSRQRRVRRR